MSSDLVAFWQGYTIAMIVAILLVLSKKEKSMPKSKDIIDRRGKRRNTTAAKVRRWLKTHVLRSK